MSQVDVSSRVSPRIERAIARLGAEAVVIAVGVGLVGLALLADQAWLDRHMFPSFFVMRRWLVVAESCVRFAMAVIGVFLAVVVRTRIGRLTARNPATVLAAIVAAVLAIGAGELVLGQTHSSAERWLAETEPQRRPDPRLGWTVVPGRAGYKTIGGRVIEYAFDAAGDRVRRVDHPVDPERPTILFVGESVMAGNGLTWEESVPAQVAAIVGIQSANLAVHGFATDQVYLRLESELPRFRQPVAVVSLFMTALFGRNLDDDRPHLGPGLVWMPPVAHGRVASLAKVVVPFRRAATVERGIALTREVLRATAALANAHGATSLLVVPQFNREDPIERTLRTRILDEGGVPYLFLEFDTNWRIPGDLHPNAPTAHAMAVAIAERLRNDWAAKR